MIKKIVLMISMISLVTCTPRIFADDEALSVVKPLSASYTLVCSIYDTLPSGVTSQITAKNALIFTGIAYSAYIITACAPVVAKAAQDIANTIGQKTKDAIEACSDYAKKIAIGIVGSVGAYEAINNTSKVGRVCGIALLLAAGKFAIGLQRHQRPPAAAPAAAQGGQGHANLQIGPINFTGRP